VTSYRPITAALSTSDEDLVVSSVKRQIFRGWMERHRAQPRQSSRPDSRSGRDPDAPDYITFGSFEKCDISAALVHTEVIYTAPEPEEEEEE
jgi:hypothetical protein